LQSPDEGRVAVMGGSETWVVPARELAQTSVLVELPASQVKGSQTRVVLGIYGPDEKLFETVKTGFVGPRPRIVATP
jgi:hypothetical protein